jgi:hypothetical protein
MTVQLELETYRHLVMYLGGRVSLEDFRKWFDSHTWDQAQWESPLVGQIELALAELSSNNLTEQEFVEVLRSSIPTLTLEMQPITRSDLPTLVTSAASNTTKSLSAFVVPNSRLAGAPEEIPVTFLPWRPVLQQS